MEKRLKALPDFGNAGVWVDDDTVEVTEALGPIKEVNGSEAKFLLRFLFKRAAMFRESDVKAATQVRRGRRPLSPCVPCAVGERRWGSVSSLQARRMEPDRFGCLGSRCVGWRRAFPSTALRSESLRPARAL